MFPKIQHKIRELIRDDLTKKFPKFAYQKNTQVKYEQKLYLGFLRYVQSDVQSDILNVTLNP